MVQAVNSLHGSEGKSLSTSNSFTPTSKLFFPMGWALKTLSVPSASAAEISDSDSVPAPESTNGSNSAVESFATGPLFDRKQMVTVIASFAALFLLTTGSEAIDVVSTAGASVGATVAIVSSKSSKVLPLYYSTPLKDSPKSTLFSSGVAFHALFKTRRRANQAAAKAEQQWMEKIIRSTRSRVRGFQLALRRPTITPGLPQPEIPTIGTKMKWTATRGYISVRIPTESQVIISNSPSGSNLTALTPNGHQTLATETTDELDVNILFRHSYPENRPETRPAGFGIAPLPSTTTTTITHILPDKKRLNTDDVATDELIETSAYSVPDEEDDAEAGAFNASTLLSSTFAGLDEGVYAVETIFERVTSRVARTALKMDRSKDIQLLSFFEDYYKEQGYF